jgi:hypothetical protein
MGVASTKSRAKKSMRVATIFTGVATLTTGMAQAADAQGTHAAVRSKNTGRVAQPDGKITGSIEYVSDCGNYVNSNSTWFHYRTMSATIFSPYCFGFRGAYLSPPGVGLRSQCGGNNHGDLVGAKGGASVSATFGPGTTWRKLNWSHFYLITIDSWTGHDAC